MEMSAHVFKTIMSAHEQLPQKQRGTIGDCMYPVDRGLSAIGRETQFHGKYSGVKKTFLI